MLLHNAARPSLTGDHDTDMHILSRWAYDTYTRTGHDVVLATVHGSHLYGTFHPDSDLDVFVVIADGSNTAKVLDGLDVQQHNLDTWLRNLHAGSHQAVEALFSPYLVAGEKWGPFVAAQRPSRYNFVKKCRSAAAMFLDRGDRKSVHRAFTQLRHAHSYFHHGDPFSFVRS